MTVQAGVMIGYIAIPLILLYVMGQLEKEHTFLKVFLMFFTFSGIFLIGALIVNPESATLPLTFYKYTITIFSTFVLYVFVYFIYKMFQYFETIPKIKGWKK